MRSSKVDVHELIAWGLDDYPSRSSANGVGQEELTKQVERARSRLTECECYASCPALLVEETERIRHLLSDILQRKDLQEEHEGLEWTLGVVDLRRLLAFQRRLVFSPTRHPTPTPSQDDWPQLISLAAGPRRGTENHLVRHSNATGGLDISLHSSNPDLQLRLNPKVARGDLSPLCLYGGSPFRSSGTSWAMVFARWIPPRPSLAASGGVSNSCRDNLRTNDRGTRRD